MSMMMSSEMKLFTAYLETIPGDKFFDLEIHDAFKFCSIQSQVRYFPERNIYRVYMCSNHEMLLKFFYDERERMDNDEFLMHNKNGTFNFEEGIFPNFVYFNNMKEEEFLKLKEIFGKPIPTEVPSKDGLDGYIIRFRSHLIGNEGEFEYWVYPPDEIEVQLEGIKMIANYFPKNQRDLILE